MDINSSKYAQDIDGVGKGLTILQMCERNNIDVTSDARGDSICRNVCGCLPPENKP